MRKSVLFVVSFLMLASILIAACEQATATPVPVVNSPVPVDTVAPSVEPTATTEAAPPVEEVAKVRWFIGLGTGANPEQQEAQDKVVADFNAANPDIILEKEVVQNDVAYDTLKTEIASGNPPDLVGPVGVKGANGFAGAWLDLMPEIEASGYDQTQYEQALWDFWKVDGVQVGVPFAVYPSMLFYRRGLFDEAGLEYPPHKYGDKYNGKDWDMANVRDTGMLLTLDKNGNDATSADFDAENIVQYGYSVQWTDSRGEATLFGAGTAVAADGKAQIPDNWRAAWHWYYDAMWKDHFMPTGPAQASDLLAAGNPFSSGNIAMTHCHTWYTCCLGTVTDWDLADMPSYNGKITAKLHSDTFRILKSTENPAAAFKVLSYIVGPEAGPSLLTTYGGVPARKSEQEAFFASLDEKYPQGVDWQVAIDSLAYPDNPNHESDMPNFLLSNDRFGAFQTLYNSTPGLDLDVEIDKMKADLDKYFKSAK